jgi:SAM-dependent methyltransferase
MTTGALARYYDRLGRWNRVAGVIRHGGGRSSLTVHRALADPAADGRPTFTRIHDVIVAAVSARSPQRMLDAGCGLGGTMIACTESCPELSATGVTLSRSQAEQANAAAARRGLGLRVRARVGSFDDPPRGPFDLIVAVESLAHSGDPRQSVARLANVLAPGGTFIIVDDMPEPGADATGDLAVFKEGWNCPVLADHSTHLETLAAAGLIIVSQRDLTADCRPRTFGRIALLMRLNVMARLLLPSAALRQVLDAHRGGLALERLLRTGAVRYRLLVARRPVLQVS